MIENFAKLIIISYKHELEVFITYLSQFSIKQNLWRTLWLNKLTFQKISQRYSL